MRTGREDSYSPLVDLLLPLLAADALSVQAFLHQLGGGFAVGG
jgi:hypothetical protein